MGSDIALEANYMIVKMRNVAGHHSTGGETAVASASWDPPTAP